MKRIGFLATTFMLVLSATGCGSATNNLGGARDEYGINDMYDYDYGAYGYDNTYGYNMYDTYDPYAYNGYGTYDYDVYGYNAYGDYGGDMVRDHADGGAGYWDGYGINEGRTISSELGSATKDLLN